jgi:macrolide-specific efflux system membrane fusion protein
MKYYPSKFLLWSVLIAGLILSGCSGATSKEEPTPTPLPTVAALAKPTYTVQRGEVVELLAFNGRITPINETEIFFRTNGRIRKIYVEEGDKIKTGQVIADLEGIDDLQRQMALNQLNLQRTQIYAENAQLNYDIFIDTTPTWTEDYDKQVAIQKNELALANIAVQEASLGLQELQNVISDTLLIAPVDGEIISLDVGEGVEVQAFKSVGIVADITQLEVSADVSSENTQKIAVGMEASIGPISGLGGEFSGSIRRMPFDLHSTGGGEDRTVRIALNGSAAEAGYELGNFVKVTVVLQKKDDTLWVPPQAIRTFEGRQFVVLQDGSAQRRVDVKLGILGEDRVEILSGLAEGQVVVSP